MPWDQPDGYSEHHDVVARPNRGCARSLQWECYLERQVPKPRPCRRHLRHRGQRRRRRAERARPEDPRDEAVRPQEARCDYVGPKMQQLRIREHGHQRQAARQPRRRSIETTSTRFKPNGSNSVRVRTLPGSKAHLLGHGTATELVTFPLARGPPALDRPERKADIISHGGLRSAKPKTNRVLGCCPMAGDGAANPTHSIGRKVSKVGRSRWKLG